MGSCIRCAAKSKSEYTIHHEDSERQTLAHFGAPRSAPSPTYYIIRQSTTLRVYPLFWLFLGLAACHQPGTPIFPAGGASVASQDSLYRLLEQTEYYATRNMDSSMVLVEQILAVLPELKDPYLRARAHHQIANSYEGAGRYREALGYVTTAEELLLSTDSLAWLAEAQTLRGLVEGAMGEERTSSETLYRAVATCERDSVRCQRQQIHVRLLLGTRYFHKGLLETAGEQFYRANEIARRLGHERDMARALQFLSYIAYERREWQEGIDNVHASLRLLDHNTDADYERLHAYYTMTGGFEELGQLDSALYYAGAAVRLADRVGEYHAAMVNTLRLAELHLMKGETAVAGRHLERAKAMEAEMTGAENSYLIYYHFLCRAKYQLARGNTSAADELFARAQRVANETGYVTFKKNFYEQTYKAYKNAGDPDRALLYFEQLNVLLDSTNNQRVSEQLAELTIRYRTQEKELELRAQEQEVNRSQWIRRYLGIIVLLLLGAAFYSYRNLVLNRRANSLLRDQTSTLERLNATKSRFFRNITHELRNPLTMVLGPLENALQSTKNVSLRRDLITAQRQGHKMLDLVHEISELNRLDNDDLQVHLRPVELRRLLESLVNNFRPAVERKRIDLKFDYRLPRKVRPQTDPAKLERVVNNLLSNALKYTDPEGKIYLRAYAPRPGAMRVEVEDTGIGIPNDALPHVFDRFYQVNHPRTKSSGGTGIGLALARELTEKLGGTISVESAEGKGTVFSIDLPLVGHTTSVAH